MDPQTSIIHMEPSVPGPSISNTHDIMTKEALRVLFN